MAKKNIVVDSLPIRLGQFLKYVNMVQDGIEAKFIILNGQVKVNGVIETRRGRKLHASDIVQVEDGDTFLIVK